MNKIVGYCTILVLMGVATIVLAFLPKPSNEAQFATDEQHMGERWVTLSQAIKRSVGERSDLSQKWQKICQARGQVLGQDVVTLLPGCTVDKNASGQPPNAVPMTGTVGPKK